MSYLKNRLKKIVPLYKLYLFFFNNNFYNHKKKEKSFFKKLGPFKLVFDIGANQGNQTVLYNLFGSNVIVVEPDDFNYKLLLKRFQKNRKIKILNFAISDTIGNADFFQITPGSEFNTLSKKWKESLQNQYSNRWHTTTIFKDVIKVQTTTLDELINKYGKPEYIKIDVEGHELACLKGLTQKIPVISFEANLPEFKCETLQIIDHLKNINNDIHFNYIVNDENFAFKVHVSADEFYDFMKKTELKFMDVFSFMGDV